MTTKICNNCGRRVDESVKFCPTCKSQSFRPYAEIAKHQNSDLIYNLFYWQYGDQYKISKSKVFSAVTLIVFAIGSLSYGSLAGGFVMIILGLITSLSIYVIGYVINKIRANPTPAILENSDNGFGFDLKTMLLCWQNKLTGEFFLSKTKIISLLIFIFGCILTLSSHIFEIAVMYIVGLILSVPAYVIGYGVHTLTNSNPTNPKVIRPSPKPKKVKAPEPKKSIKTEVKKAIPTPSNDSDVIPQYAQYKAQIEDLKSQFDAKDKSTRNLIEKRFEPPQLTYTRFISLVDKAGEMFSHQSESALNMIDLATEYTARIDGEIRAKIEILKSIIQKLDDLSNELILSMDESSEDDIDGLVEDMESLIESVKDYK